MPESSREAAKILRRIRVSAPVERLRWFTNLRWWAVWLGLTVCLGAQMMWPVAYHLPVLVGVFFLLALLNAFYARVGKGLARKTKGRTALVKKVRRFIHVQVSMDLALLTLLLVTSGGVDNPFFMFYLFHVVTSSIALPWKDSLAYAILGASLPWLLWGCSHLGWVGPLWTGDPPWDATALSALLLVFSALCMGVWYFLTSLSGDLSEKERALEDAGERLRQANEDLWRLDDQKNRFFRQIAHELKNPVAAVSSCLEAAESTWPKGKALRAKDMVDRAKSRLGAVSELMDDLIWLSQAKSTDPPYRREEMDPSAMVRRAAQDLEEKIGPQGPKIVVQGASTVKLTLWADPRAFRRVVDNLLENAVKYTPEGRGPIKVRLEDQERWLLVSVEDPGIGIPETERTGLFQEFVRASNARSSGLPGTGLGLAIVKRILDWHGGEVVIHSEQGKGTRVDTKWPVRL